MPGGGGDSIKGRYARFGEWLKEDIPVEMPEVSISDWRDCATFSNGRHSQTPPELALMIQHIQNYSAHEINHTNFPKWIRQALLLRKKQYDANIESDRILASNADYIVDGNTPDPLGEMRRWVGGTQFIKINHGGSINVEPQCFAMVADNWWDLD
ncbi:unnamed protein product [Sphagnum tenellum]